MAATTLARAGYQAWPVPQCGQQTEVETSAWNWKPHEQA
jgi:hypothetical protein